MFFVVVNNPIGNLISNGEGEFEWIKKADIESYITNPFEDKKALNDKINKLENFSGTIEFLEVNHISEKF